LPEAFTTILAVVAPVLQKLPVVDEEVKVTLSPAQKVNGPLVEIVGVTGSGLTTTLVEDEARLVHEPSLTLTE
jgi:hypothetical protein